VFKSVGLCHYLRLRCVNFVAGPSWRENVCLCLSCLDSFDAISQCMHHFVGVCDGGINDAFVLELHGVGQSFAFGVFDVALCVR